MSGGIYKIINPIANAIYIGQTTNFQRRWNEHSRDLKEGSHSNSRLQELWNESSEEHFLFEIISYAPKFNNKLEVQKYLGLEEYIEIKKHRNINLLYVLNITSGEIVTTQKAWSEWIKIHKEKEATRIGTVKKSHQKRTIQRRELEEYRDLAKSIRFKNEEDLKNKISKLHNKKNRSGFFYRILNLIPNEENQKEIQIHITELEKKLENLKNDKIKLQDFLILKGYKYGNLNNSGDVFEIYYKLKKDAYRLRNWKSELIENQIEAEIPLDRDCPSIVEMEDSIYNIFGYLSENDEQQQFLNSDISKDILLLQRGYLHNQAHGFLGMAIINYHQVLIDGKHRTDYYISHLRNYKGFFKYKYHYHILEARLLFDKNCINDPNFYFHLKSASECEDIDAFNLYDIADLLDKLNTSDSKILRFNLLMKIYEFEWSIVDNYELGFMHLDGEVTIQDTKKAIEHFKISYYLEHDWVSFVIAYIYMTDEKYKNLEKSMAWYDVYKKLNKDNGFDQEDIDLLESKYLKLNSKDLETIDKEIDLILADKAIFFGDELV